MQYLEHLEHNIHVYTHTHTHTTAHDSQPMHLFALVFFFTFLSQLQIWVTIIPNKII